MKPRPAVLLIVLVLYVVLGGVAVISTILAEKTPEFGDGFLVVTTAVSGVMVSAFASSMNIDPPANKKLAQGQKESKFVKFFKIVKEFFVKLRPSDFTENYYVWAQIVMGAACILVWVFKTDVTPPVVKNIGSLALTIFIAVAMKAINPEES